MIKSGWQRASLGNLIDTQKGYAFKSGWYCETGRRIVKVSNFTEDSIDSSGLTCIPESTAADYLKYQLCVGDVVVQTVGSWPNNPASVVGKCVRTPSEVAGSLLNQNAVRLYPSTHLEKQFLFYLLKGEDFKTYIVGTAQGAASQAAITLEAIRGYEFDLPTLPVQQRIAGILSAYDELIENSLRRIKILETMARALYREWFVNFRFPGHENHPRVASPLGEIPQGWDVKKLGEIIVSHIGGGWGKDVLDKTHTEPAWVIRGTDIPEARYSQVGGLPHRFHTASNLRSRRLAAGDIVFEVSGGSKGQPVGRTLLITPDLLKSLAGDVICASFCKRVQPDISGYGSEILYLSFLEGYESGEIEQYQVQSTGISNFKWTEYLANTDRVVPPAAIREQFRGHVAPLLIQVATLGRRIQNLRRTRDLLLPRLLSGQIDVEAA